jgi:hypothetical protein
MPRPRRARPTPRYFLTVQVAQSLEEATAGGEGGGGGRGDGGGDTGTSNSGAGNLADGVGPVAYEFTLEGIDLLDTAGPVCSSRGGVPASAHTRRVLVPTSLA